MPYTISEGDEMISHRLNSFFFYMPFALTGQGSITLLHSAAGAGCYLAVLMDGHPQKAQPAAPGWRDGATAQAKLTISSTEDDVGDLKFAHMTLVNQVQIERENEWSELRIYHGDDPNTEKPQWIITGGWNMGAGGPNQNAHHFTKTFDFGEIQGAPCDETVVVWNWPGHPQRITLCRRLIAGTIAQEIMDRGAVDGTGGRMPSLIVKSVGNSADVESPADRVFFSNTDGGARVNRSGYVMIAAGVFAYQSADTLLEEWRSVNPQGGNPAGINDLEDVRRRLGRIAFAPENVRADGNRQLRKLCNVDFDHADGVTTGKGIDDAPVEVLFVEANQNSNIA